LRANLAEGKAAEPGEVTATDNGRIVVACGKGSLALEVLQKPGGKPLPVAQFIQSMPIKAGDRFVTA
jgi:methionyl-tRNA formyltransferase